MLKKIKLYIDTSVLGGLLDLDDPMRVNTAESIFRLIKEGQYQGLISLLTLEEILKAPPAIQEKLKSIISNSNLQILEETEDCVELANLYIDNAIIPIKYRNDARHIAIGVCHGVDFIVSWNYRHMVNITVHRLVNSMNLKMGYALIEIVSPEEVIGYDAMEI